MSAPREFFWLSSFLAFRLAPSASRLASFVAPMVAVTISLSGCSSLQSGISTVEYEKNMTAGNAALQRGDLVSAESSFRKASTALDESEQTYLKVGKAFVSLGNVYQTQKKFKLAEEAYIRGLAVLRAHVPADDSILAYPLTQLGGVYFQQGKFDQAGGLLEEAVTFLEAAPGSDDRLYFHLLNNLGSIYTKKKQYEKAGSLLEKSIVLAAKMDPEDPLIAVGKANLANNYRDRNLNDKARKLYEESLTKLRSTYGPEHEEVVYTMQSYITFLRKNGESAAAEKMEKDVKAIKARHRAAPSGDISQSPIIKEPQ